MVPRVLLCALAIRAAAGSAAQQAPSRKRLLGPLVVAGSGVGLGWVLRARRRAAAAAAAVPDDAAAAGDAAARVDAKAVRRADALFKKRTPEACDAAARLYEAEVAKAEDGALLLKAADAVNTAMRLRTDGNTITIAGTVDTAARRAVWKRDGARALALAERGLAATAGTPDARALGIYMDAFMFSCSSKSLVQQALTGTGTKYRKMAEHLQKKHPKYDSDVGSAVLACFYYVAPWPVGNARKAIDNAKRAVRVGGPTLRNLYYVGVIAYVQEDFLTAQEYFTRALAAKPGSPTEADFALFMRAESARVLDLAREKV